jgi:hypothetical protein
MSVLSEKLTRERFRELYADEKPNCELIDGRPERKALGSKRHARLQLILGQMLDELGFRAATELTLAISETWEPSRTWPAFWARKLTRSTRASRLR